MKFISKNSELIILLVIIFYIFFTLTVMYENKIYTLKLDLESKNNCISQESLYFKENNGKYEVNIVFEKNIAEGYAEVLFNNRDTVLHLDQNTIGLLSPGTTYKLVIQKTSNTLIYKNDLQDLIDNNKLAIIE